MDEDSLLKGFELQNTKQGHDIVKLDFDSLRKISKDDAKDKEFVLRKIDSFNHNQSPHQEPQNRIPDVLD